MEINKNVFLDIARGFVDRIMNNTTLVEEEAAIDEPSYSSINEKLENVERRASQLCEVIAASSTSPSTSSSSLSHLSTSSSAVGASTLQAATTRSTTISTMRPAASSDAIVARHAYIIRHAPLLPNSIDDCERQSALLTNTQTTHSDDVAASIVAVLEKRLVLTPSLRSEQARWTSQTTLHEQMRVMLHAATQATRCWPQLVSDSLSWLVLLLLYLLSFFPF